MNTENPNELEEFIHKQLRALPEHQAPADLASSVMRIIESRAQAPWWKQPFTAWPAATRTALYVALAVILAGVVLVIWAPAEQLTLSALVERAESLSWVTVLADTFFKTVSLITQSLGWFSLAVLGTIFAMMYASCLVTGLALWRVTHPRPTLANV